MFQYNYSSLIAKKRFSINIPSENADTSNEKEEKSGNKLKRWSEKPLQGPLALSLWESESVSKFNLKDKMMRKLCKNIIE